jgi:D-alanyl-D-alanine carboxypeptidase
MISRTEFVLSPLFRFLTGRFLPALVLFALLVPASADARPVMLVDVETGRVLEHEDAFQRWYPASLTKLMTAYVAFRAVEEGEVDLNSPVTISERAAAAPPSKMYYGEGATMTLDTALKIIMVKSANDVALAIAESITGSKEAFIERMNAEAKRLGMMDTHFINPHGLPGEGQYTTAYDMALLARALKRDFPQYGSYFEIEAIQAGDNIYPNYNMLIGRFPGADGMKTGFICSAGYNQVSSATRNGRSVISVVLGTESLAARAEESAALLEKGLIGPLNSTITLKELEPYGEDRKEVVDLRDEICTPEAAAERAENRDEEGEVVLSSDFIKPLTRELEPVTVALGGTGGRTAFIAADIPLPTPRPKRVPTSVVAEKAVSSAMMSSASGDTAENSVPSPVPDIPVPEPRPTL